jgi:hypothetical protein
MLSAVLIAAIFVTSGVGYVGYKSLNDKLALEITRLEPRLNELIRLNKSREDQLAALSSPVELDARVRKMELGLGLPAVSQVVHLPEPVAASGRSDSSARAGEGRRAD